MALTMGGDDDDALIGWIAGIFFLTACNDVVADGAPNDLLLSPVVIPVVVVVVVVVAVVVLDEAAIDFPSVDGEKLIMLIRIASATSALDFFCDLTNAISVVASSGSDLTDFKSLVFLILSSSESILDIFCLVGE